MADESRLFAMVTQVSDSLRLTLWILIDADRDETSSFVVRKNKIVRLSNRDAKLFAGALYKLNEIPVA